MKIAAFNAKKLGLRKVKNTKVCKYLIKIISQYSIVFILEVMDKTGKAMEMLLEKLRAVCDKYEMVCSSALGRNGYKEKFVCFYREDEVELTDQHQYEDNQPGDEDAFAREPLILRFYCPTTVAKDLVLIPVHTQPNDAEKELDELHDVVKTMRRKWKSPNIMVLGDFNAAGSYLSKKKKKVIRISSPPFYWLIDDTADTTTHSNKHAYDRIVVYTKKMQNTIVPNSAKPFNFQREFRLNKKVALSVSDHYPVEVELKTAVRRREKATHCARKTSTKGKPSKKGPQKRASPAESKKRKNSAAKRKRGQQALSVTDHYPVDSKTVRRSQQQRKKAAPPKRKASSKTQTPKRRAQKRSKPADYNGRKTQAAKRKRNEQ
ncbi:deoxyribonuclease-1-like isoform X2 [Poecilia formosa]|uniref:Deoxyribonuclease 1 like 4, tandem duplicate 2 n=2 Tax=Poecilia formosa TaxID=48698 RepID=A0A096M3I7_POEFO|nr:PREDICTED: deoxyribonuclease-1-like isoform X2 [Poecilia formosa]